MSTQRAPFIVVEGIDGAGKSNVMDALAATLADADYQVQRTREPGGTPQSEAIRDILKADSEEPMPARAELLLMFAARSLHLQNLIRPALERGEAVLCDRWSDSSYAYQGAGRGIDIRDIDLLDEQVVGEHGPDLLFILDLPVESARERSDGRGNADRFDSESDGFMQRVRESYLERAAANPERYRVIDASADPQSVREQAAGKLRTWLATR